ncbi:MAG: agmatine deiminase family protein [Bryobacteraceae bacterium]
MPGRKFSLAKPAPDTPRALGFRMPAEWEPHEATWIAWPHNRDDWPGKFQAVPWVYADIVRRLAKVERVRILAQDEDAERNARRYLKKADVEMGAVEFFHHPTDRVWTRDFGPIFVKNRAGEVAITNWRFNGWAKYDNWKKDNEAPGAIAARLGLREWKLDLVLEGGSIDVNGHGILLTTEECLLSPVQARNPGVFRSEIERQMREYLGIRKVVWLGRGIAGDDTHGHVDDLARFITADTVAIASERDRSDPNYEPLRDNLLRLRTEPLNVVTLPMPEPVIFDGQRLPASYANFYIANRLVLVPTFNDANDRVALDTLARLFPGREVVGIHSTDLVWGLGTLHCMTQQQPAAG